VGIGLIVEIARQLFETRPTQSRRIRASEESERFIALLPVRDRLSEVLMEVHHGLCRVLNSRRQPAALIIRSWPRCGPLFAPR
jgi:hypothetical protein